MAELYTRTFADYFYHAVISAADMQKFVRVEQIDLGRSPILYAGDEPVGLATVGLRGDRAYCKGFGIVVPFRGRGLAGLLCGEVIRQSRLAGARTLQLGVLKQNERAVRTYLSAGLRVQRELHSFEWDAQSDPAPASGLPLPHTAEPKAVLQYHATLHPSPAIWGRDQISLSHMEGLSGLALAVGDGPAPYLLYESEGAGAVTIMDIGAPRLEQAVALLAHLQRVWQRIACNNEPADSSLRAAFIAAGFRMSAQRYHMLIDL